ncbi:MAG: class I tRNA ligase family protein [Candidatus Paceibacterota bacterium]|jgi:leucyl-tRNA synthetase
MKQYDHRKIEGKWQEEWEKADIYAANDASDKKKFYPLVEFPFPSGSGLHTGHIRSYTAMDIVARKHRMQGENVLYPIGWDAFGLPTENYAIKTGRQPKDVTKENTDNFRRQLKSLGLSFDWSREVNTTDPEYFKWTQWIFLKMYEKGLAYKAKIAINWCPKDKIGLANEEVVNGCCERCGTPVEQREKEQWMLAITKYADRLYDDLDGVDYLERIKIQQRNWIGRSEGAEISFPVKDSKENIQVFTTRPDTLFGVTYVVLAPEHPLVSRLSAANRDAVDSYVSSASKKDEIERTDAKKEKTGVRLEGVVAVNPANGVEVPVFVADYVLAQYGTGAVMAVPAHDERDLSFAKKYDLPIRLVIEPLFVKTDGVDAVRSDKPFVERTAALCIVKHWSEDTYLCSKWKSNDWQGFITGGVEDGESVALAAEREIAEETGYKSAKYVRTCGRLHSQFYHGVKGVNRFAHFDVVYLELQDGDVAEMAQEEKDLHDVHWVSRSDVRNFVNREDMKTAWDMFSGSQCLTGDGILANSGAFDGLDSEGARRKITDAVGGSWVKKFKLRDWVFSRQRYWGEPMPMIYCARCGWVPVPEKDLPVELPAVQKYEPTDTGESPLAAIDEWVNVKCPNCSGPARRETDTMPNWAGSSWYFLRYVDPKNKEVFADPKKLSLWTPIDWYNGGMEHTTLHLLYSRFWHKFLFDLGLVPTSEPYLKRTSHGMILAEGGEKMSKSRGNVINPDDLVDTYGADTLRVYEMFMGPFDQAISWDGRGLIGPRRFIERVYSLAQEVSGESLGREADVLLQKTVQKVSVDIESMGFNTAISALMILANKLGDEANVPKEPFSTFLRLLAPFAPHVAEELWHDLGNKDSIHMAPWPVADQSKLAEEESTIAVQINGKVRATFKASKAATKDDLEGAAFSLDEVKKWVGENNPKKVIVVPGRLVSIVI